MNDKIKEILEDIKGIYYFKPLLDYITNLQQRVEYLERSNNRREDTIMGLRDEIVEYEDYKSRVEKAVEYNQQVIKDTKDFYKPTEDIIYSGDTLISIAEKNINILNGRSDE